MKYIKIFVILGFTISMITLCYSAKTQQEIRQCISPLVLEECEKTGAYLEEQLRKVIISPPAQESLLKRKSFAKRFLIPASLLVVLTFTSAIYFFLLDFSKFLLSSSCLLFQASISLFISEYES